MKLIAGLGNPGIKYKNSRHNLGFMTLNDFAKESSVSWRYSQDWLGFFIKTNDFVLLKPSTFMNRSGESVKNVAHFFKIDTVDVLVVFDDLDLPFGKIRLAFDGTSAGHKGVDSVIESLGKFEFARLRIGIGSPRKVSGEAGRPKGVDPEKYVLEEFNDEEKVQLPSILQKANEAIFAYLSSGIDAAMNKFN